MVGVDTGTAVWITPHAKVTRFVCGIQRSIYEQIDGTRCHIYIPNAEYTIPGVVDRQTYCDIDAFGDHPRQFFALSDYSELFIADGGDFFPRIHLWMLFY